MLELYATQPKEFLNKNKDIMSDEIAELLENSTNTFVQNFSQKNAWMDEKHDYDDEDLSEEEEYTLKCRLKKSYSSVASSSVGTQFKIQLVELLEIIENTTPHYIRCMKYNDKKTANLYGALRAVEQLRSGGVLEAVRVSRAGYSVRLLHEDCIEQYASLIGDTPNNIEKFMS